jgi:CBS domain containing-hemolysin-like protein
MAAPADTANHLLVRKRAGLWRRLARRIIHRTGEADNSSVRHDHETSGSVDAAQKKDMILTAPWFDRLRVEDVMRPRADIVALEARATLGEAARVFSESQHSRLPIYGETLDDPIGLVHVRDVMTLLAPDADGTVKATFADRLLTRIKRDILFVPPSMKLSTLFLRMQSTRTHLALVIDEYGGTDGLVSMEDLVEQVVGEIEDEHDVEGPAVQVKPGGSVEAEGRAEIEELESILGVSLALPEHEDNFDTVAGLDVALCGRVPQRGEILPHPAGYELEILDADPRRVKRVRLKPAPGAAVPAGDA